MPIKLTGNPNVGDVVVTTVEQEVDMDNCYQVILYPDAVCSISINDNLHYKSYPAGMAIPISCRIGVTKLFVKTDSGTCNLGIWGMR